MGENERDLSWHEAFLCYVGKYAGNVFVNKGIITGLISQGYKPLEATLFGVYLHGKSGDIALEDYGYHSLLATHIIAFLGEDFKDLFKESEQHQETQNY